MREALAIELFAGTGSGTAGHVELGGVAVCFDLEYLPHHGAPAAGSHRVIQDVLTLHGSQFKDAAWIWASPPCQNYSYLAMPWSRSGPMACECRELMMHLPEGSVITGKCKLCGNTGFIEHSKAAKALRKKWETEGPDNRLFDACFRIQREAIEARHLFRSCCRAPNFCADCYIPLIVENVRGAVPWVGQQKAKFGSFYLWGDVAQIGNRVIAGRDLAEIRAGRGRFGMGVAPEKAVKLGGGLSWSDFGKPGYKAFGFNTENEKALAVAVKVPGQIQGKEYAMCRTGAEGHKTLGHVNKRDGHGHTRHLTNQAESDAVKIGGDWFSDPNSTCRKHGSRSNARKAASALIAKIPYALSRYIAEQHWP